MKLPFDPVQWLEMALCLLPMVLVTAYVIRKREQQRALTRAPFTDLVRRPAGETLRLKLEKLEEKLNELILGMISIPTLVVFWLLAVNPKDGLSPIVCFLLSAGSSVFFGIKMYKALCERSKYWLGYQGERFVGEELSRLIAAGFEIYHDVPFDGFNMDHVLVGRRGGVCSGNQNPA